MKALLKSKWPVGAMIGCLILVVLFFTSGRLKSNQKPQAEGPLEVEVAQVEQKDVPIYKEWIGTLDGLVNAEIKAQVSGYLISKNYTEGTFVKKGQLLFEVDPRPFQAALDQAKSDLAKAEGQLAQAGSQHIQSQAQLAQAEANQGKAQLDADRYTQLVKSGVASRQEYDNAVQSNLAAIAQVKAAQAGVETAKSAIVAAKAAAAAAKAAVATAELNLGFTKITSLIDGIAGIAQAQVGNLVGPSTGRLTSVSTLDPVKVYFNPSEQEYLNWVKRHPTKSEQEVATKNLELELILADGSTYPQKGKFFLRDLEVDKQTGAIRIAGIFPNPGNVLRPGQYGRIRTVISLRQGALLVPQRAVTELQGSYQVAVVGSDNKVAVRRVKVGDRFETMWIIEDGIKPGETVVAEGIQKVRPDMVVNPKPIAAPSLTAAR